MKNKKIIIGVVCVLIVIIVLCVVLAIVSKQDKKESASDFGINSQGELMYEPSEDIDFENVEVSTIKFKLKNTLEKNIIKVYIRDNTDENFSRELCGELKAGEEKDLEYGNYAPVFIWDLKMVFEDGEEKTLNSLLAANVFKEGATLELTAVGDSIEAINKNMNDETMPEAEVEGETLEEASEEVATEEITNENKAEKAEENTAEEQTEEESIENNVEETAEEN